MYVIYWERGGYMSEQVVHEGSTPVVKQVDEREKVVSVPSWLLYLIILSIPLVNIIMLFVWAFGSGVNKNKSNLAKASLILAILYTILFIVLSFMIGSVVSSLLEEFFIFN